MDITTIVGFISGFTLLVMGMLFGGTLQAFMDVPSFLITAGGSLAALLISSPLMDLVRWPGILGKYVLLWPGDVYAKVHPEMYTDLGIDRPEPASDERIAQVRSDLALGAALMGRLQRYPIGIGAVGSLVGIVNMLQYLEDLSHIGPGLATAILTLFYGGVLTYLVILPVKHKLEARLRSLDERFW